MSQLPYTYSYGNGRDTAPATPAAVLTAAAEMIGPIVIDRGIPLPRRTGGPGREPSKVSLTARAMQVGDSVALPDEKLATRLLTALRDAHSSKGGPQVGASRKLPDGTYRVWRIA